MKVDGLVAYLMQAWRNGFKRQIEQLCGVYPANPQEIESGARHVTNPLLVRDRPELSINGQPALGPVIFIPVDPAGHMHIILVVWVWQDGRWQQALSELEAEMNDLRDQIMAARRDPLAVV
ncbi:MAG: hypothetical protein ABIJ72_00620 [bacterium]